MTISVSVSPGSNTYTPMEYIFKIKNPEMVENEYTVRNDTAAREVMQRVGVSDFEKLQKLMDGLDFTAISTREISRFCSELRVLGWDDRCAVSFLAQGNMDTGFDGKPRNIDVKFNAIPLINEQLDGHRVLAANRGLTHDSAFGRILDSLVSANHVVAALTYLAKSAQKLPSINEQV